MQIKRYFFITIFLCTISVCSFAFFFSPFVFQQYSCTIMLDPTGDAQTPGRTIDNHFERSITLQFAQQLKQVLEERYRGLRCILTRTAGEIAEPLQNANYANRVNVDLFITISFYQEKQAKPQLFLYTCSYNDDFLKHKSDLAFYPFDQIHQYNAERTKNWSTIIKQSLDSPQCKQFFDCKGIFPVPFKSLMGIKAPAFAFEAGVKTKDDWHQYVEPFATSLHSIITQSN